MPVRLALLELSPLLAPGEDERSRLLLGHPRDLWDDVVHPPVRADDHRLGKPVRAADLEVDRVVARRDLERAGAELGLDALVGDDRDGAFDERHDGLLAHEVPVALVVRMHRNADVPEDRRGPHGRDRDRAGPVCEGVADVEELVVRLDVVQLEVGERALVVRAPVDDAVVAVEVALLPEVDEVAQDGAHVALVHREALAPVVHRRAHAPELGHDRAAVLAKPFPDPRFERLAAELLAGRSLALEVLLDHALRRDARVVVAGLEQAVVPLHAPPPNQRVGER